MTATGDPTEGPAAASPFGATVAGRSPRFAELEGVRGLAAVVVTLYHGLLCFYLYSFLGPGQYLPAQLWVEPYLYGNPLMALFSGTFAVAIFFVLSGFVLSIGYFRTGRTNIIRSHAVKRYPRLMIPALASTLMCFAAITWLGNPLPRLYAINHNWWIGANWKFSPSLLGALTSATYDIYVRVGSPYNNVLWTMGYEMSGSFLIFVFLALFGPVRYRRVLYALLAVVTFNTWYLAFVIGMVLADLHAGGALRSRRRPVAVLAVAFVAMLVLGGAPVGLYEPTMYFHLPWQNRVNWPVMLITAGATILLVLVLTADQVRSFFRHKIFQVFGTYSFSLYLVHIVVFYEVGVRLFLWLHSERSVRYSVAALVSLLASFVVIAGMAYAFERLVDRPAVRFATWLSRRMVGPAATATAPRAAPQTHVLPIPEPTASPAPETAEPARDMSGDDVARHGSPD